MYWWWDPESPWKFSRVYLKFSFLGIADDSRVSLFSSYQLLCLCKGLKSVVVRKHQARVVGYSLQLAEVRGKQGISSKSFKWQLIVDIVLNSVHLKSFCGTIFPVHIKLFYKSLEKLLHNSVKWLKSKVNPCFTSGHWVQVCICNVIVLRKIRNFFRHAYEIWIVVNVWNLMIVNKYHHVSCIETGLYI